ncbi:MAG: hypothetical protein AAFQ82_14640 [Myxococcota bacterium]
MNEVANTARVPNVEKRIPAAAFYDLEGTLCSTNIVHTYAYFARNSVG